MQGVFNRREFVKVAGLALSESHGAKAQPAKPLFDGKTLHGWIQIENSATSLARAGITDPAAFVGKLTNGADPMSVYLRSRLEGSVNTDPAALVKDLNQLIAGPSIYDPARFRGLVLRSETRQLLQSHPRGQELARLNKLLLEDAYPAELAQSALTGWTVKDGAMASTGSGRGVIYTAKDYGRFRLMFTIRHLSGNPDHQACVLIFCTRPQAGEKPLDALAGIQFQVPNGGHRITGQAGTITVGRNLPPSPRRTSTCTIGSASRFWRMPQREPRAWPWRSRWEVRRSKCWISRTPVRAKPGQSPGRCTTPACWMNTKT